jgi:hypothetical protein
MIQSAGQIGKIIREGVVFDAKNWAGGGLNADSLQQAVQDFFALLAERQVAYVLVGGIALLHYVEGRNTQDLDLLMAASALDSLPELEIMSRDANFVRAQYNGLQIDILLTQNPLFHKVWQEQAHTQPLFDREIRLATVEGLLLLKLYALPSLYRQGNFARVGIYENDVAVLLHDYRPDTAVLIQQLAAYVSESDLNEIKNIIAEIESRISRFTGGGKV